MPTHFATSYACAQQALSRKWTSGCLHCAGSGAQWNCFALAFSTQTLARFTVARKVSCLMRCTSICAHFSSKPRQVKLVCPNIFYFDVFEFNWCSAKIPKHNEIAKPQHYVSRYACLQSPFTQARWNCFVFKTLGIDTLALTFNWDAKKLLYACIYSMFRRNYMAMPNNSAPRDACILRYNSTVACLYLTHTWRA